MTHVYTGVKTPPPPPFHAEHHVLLVTHVVDDSVSHRYTAFCFPLPLHRWKPVSAARKTIAGSSRYRPPVRARRVACASQGTAGATAAAAAAGSSAGAAAAGSSGGAGGVAGALAAGTGAGGSMSSM
jgi:hypothetical protein